MRSVSVAIAVFGFFACAPANRDDGASVADAGVRGGDAGSETGGLGEVNLQVAAGGNHTCALLESGAIRCWGHASRGQLGYGNVTDIGDDEPPYLAGDVDIGGRAIQVTAGDEHTCALRDTGAVVCWGLAENGRLGYGNLENIGDDEVPSAAGTVALGEPAIQISAGTSHTCALMESGAVRCWGDGADGRLGTGDTEDIGDDEGPTAVDKVRMGRKALEVEAGGSHTCALLEGGDVRCWGLGILGQLGYGNQDSVLDPSTVGSVEIGGPAAEIAVGNVHSCALLAETGEVRCWGQSSEGYTGYPNTERVGDDERPIDMPTLELGALAVDIDAGSLHTCARLATGALTCWGNSFTGQLGYGDEEAIGDNEHPSAAGNVSLGNGARVLEVSAGHIHTCAITNAEPRAIHCWGSGNFGRLGYGNKDAVGDDEPPSDVGDVPFR